jgi:HPt (histidine-containing phosphotransfer) domain-containing protein
MMPGEPPREQQLAAMMASAQAHYVERLPTKLAEIEAMAASGDWEALGTAAHKLHGSAGVYGFALVSDAAGQLEEILLTNGETLDAAASADVRAALRALRATIEETRAQEP